MNRIDYGGRFSTNLIDDVRAPGVPIPSANDRSSYTNFRPFEELAQNFKAPRYVAAPSKTPISVGYESSWKRVDVERFTPVLSGYTYVPPLTTLSIAGFDGGTSYYQGFQNAIDGGLNYTRYLLSSAAGLVSYITRPLVSAAAAVQAAILSRTYTLQNGLESRLKFSVPGYAQTIAVLAALGIGAIILLRLLAGGSDATQTGQGNNGASAVDNPTSRAVSAEQSSRQDSTRATSSNATSRPSSDSGTSSTGSPGSAAGTIWDVKAPASSSTGTGTTTTTSPPTGTQNTTPTQTADDGGGSSAGSLLPPTYVEIPPASVQVEDQSVLETDGTTITVW